MKFIKIKHRVEVSDIMRSQFSSVGINAEMEKFLTEREVESLVNIDHIQSVHDIGYKTVLVNLSGGGLSSRILRVCGMDKGEFVNMVLYGGNDDTI